MRRRVEPCSAEATAAGIVLAKVRATAAYRLGRRAVVLAAIDEIGPRPDVARLRALGGITAVVQRVISEVDVLGLDDELGSVMFPLTPRQAIAREIGALRTEVQRQLAGGAG